MITAYHAKLFAHELGKRHSVADAEKLPGALINVHDIARAGSYQGTIGVKRHEPKAGEIKVGVSLPGTASFEEKT